MKNDLYSTLGVDKNAGEDEIKAAYRAKARENHPDKPGGSTEKMQELVLAYDVLKSKTKRDRYDKTGSTEDTPFDTKFQGLMQELVVTIIERNEMTDLEQSDLIDKIKYIVRERQKDAKKSVEGLSNNIEKYSKIGARFSGERINRVIDLNIKEMEMKIGYIEEDIKFFQDVLNVLNDYKYRFDPPPEPNPEPQGFYFSTSMSSEDRENEIERQMNKFRKFKEKRSNNL